MAAKKTTERRAAALISKAEGIKLKSAYRRIQRAAKADKPIKAAGLSRYGLRLVRSVEREKRAAAKRPAAAKKTVSKIIEDFGRRVLRYRFSGKRLMKVFLRALFGSSGSGDRRERWVRENVTAGEANEILNSDTVFDAIEVFNDVLTYMKIVDVEEFHYFEFEGESFGSDHFDEEV